MFYIEFYVDDELVQGVTSFEVRNNYVLNENNFFEVIARNNDSTMVIQRADKLYDLTNKKIIKDRYLEYYHKLTEKDVFHYVSDYPWIPYDDVMRMIGFDI